MSWWEFAEHSGFSGNELALYNVTCPFCYENGNFATKHHAERKHATSNKVLNYDLVECKSCGNLTFIFWSAASFGAGLHDFRCVPTPRQTTRFPKHWPDDIG